MKERFILEVAHATSDFDKVVTKGPVNFSDFVGEFRSFDWSGEVIREYWNRKSSPGIGVTNLDNGSTFWTSAWDWLSLLNPADGPAHTPALSFIVGLNNGPKPPDIYCRKEDRNSIGCMFCAESPQVVEDLFLLYFRERYDELYQKLYTLSVMNSVDE